MTPPDDKNDLLSRIEDLWQEASSSSGNAPDPAAAMPPQVDFANVRARFETVSKLQPPASADADNPFNDLVRSVVRDYIDNELEDTIRKAVGDELGARDGQPEK